MAQGELSLADYWRILQKRKWEVIGSVFLVLAATNLVIRKQEAIYRATAKVKLERAQALSSNVFQGFQSYYENPIATESRVIESRAVAELVAVHLDPSVENSPPHMETLVAEVQSAIKAEAISDTNIIQIVATGRDPKRVAQLANAAAEAYIESNLQEKNKQAKKVKEFVQTQLEQTDVRLKRAEEALKRMRAEGRATGMAVNMQNRIIDLESQLAQLQPKLTEAHPDIKRLKEQIAQLQGQLKGLPDAEMEYARLSREDEVNEKTYRTLRERLEEARIAEAEKVADATIIERAIVPVSPITPPKRFGWGVGLMLGVLLGCVLAFVFETLDTSIGTIEDVEKLLQVPVLAVIPHISRFEDPALASRHWWAFWKRKEKGEKKPLSKESREALHVHYHPHSITSEAYRILRTNLKLGADRKVLLVTSAGPAEGKTTLLSNLGVVMAQSGSKTLILSTDLRRPELDHIFGLEGETGLSEVVQGTVSFDHALRWLSDFILGRFGFDETVKHPYLANLFVMGSGHHLPNSPPELLGSKAMQDILTQGRSQFDVVLLDLPPILPVADSLVLAPQVDGIVLVYQVGRISRGALLRAKMQLDAAGGKLIGVVLNHVRPEVKTESQYYYYAYQRRYASEKASAASTPPPPRQG